MAVQGRGLGFIDIPTLIALVDSGVAYYTKSEEYGQTKEYGKKSRGLQQISHQAELANKAKELALREKGLTTTGRTAILEDMGVKKVVGIGSVSVIGLVALALILIYINK